MVIDKPKDKLQVIDIVKNAKRTGIKTNIGIKKECVWILDETHKGEVEEVAFFDGAIKITCCEYHLEHHIAIMGLCHSPQWIKMHGKGNQEEVNAALELKHDDCVEAANKYGLLTVLL